MYYLYFPYSLVVSSLLMVRCIRKKTPAWWALVVLLAPVTAPYYFFKTSRENRPLFTTLFCLSFLLVSAGEVYLFSQEKARLKLAGYSPAARQMMQLSEDLKGSTTALDDAIQHLEEMSKVVSRRKGIGEALSFIGAVRVKMIEKMGAVERFISFTRDYRKILEKEGFSDILFMEAFYTNPMVIVYQKSLDSYLTDFEKFLGYTFDNFESIDGKSYLHLRNYDAYYMEYRRAVDRHNRLCVKRIKFQKTILEKHPGLEPYLPTMLQTDFLKLWE